MLEITATDLTKQTSSQLDKVEGAAAPLAITRGRRAGKPRRVAYLLPTHVYESLTADTDICPFCHCLILDNEESVILDGDDRGKTEAELDAELEADEGTGRLAHVSCAIGAGEIEPASAEPAEDRR